MNNCKAGERKRPCVYAQSCWMSLQGCNSSGDQRASVLLLLHGKSYHGSYVCCWSERTRLFFHTSMFSPGVTQWMTVGVFSFRSMVMEGSAEMCSMCFCVWKTSGTGYLCRHPSGARGCWVIPEEFCFFHIQKSQ